VAARLCAVAPGGEVLVSETTRSAADPLPDVCWGERELHWLRGVSQPVATYLISPVFEELADDDSGRLATPRRALVRVLQALRAPIAGWEVTV
jgi:hypothetical protein